MSTALHVSHGRASRSTDPTPHKTSVPRNAAARNAVTPFSVIPAIPRRRSARFQRPLSLNLRLLQGTSDYNTPRPFRPDQSLNDSRASAHPLNHRFINACGQSSIDLPREASSVTEHRIRLRGGWECLPIGSPESETYRLTLPTRWSLDSPASLRIIRRFNQPPLESGDELVLRMEQVPGIRRLDLDGQRMIQGSPHQSVYELALNPSVDRHQLILEIETPTPDHAATEVPDWGAIALVIRSPRSAPAGGC
jgi:hypothetical protein